MRHERKIQRPVDFVLAGRYATPFKLQGFCKKKKDNWILQLYSTDFRPIGQNSR